MSQPLSMHGAIDLGALAASRQAQAQASRAAAEAPVGVIKDVTTAGFQADVIEQSMTVPVVIDLWASWCQPCKQLTPILEKVASEYAGRFVLAKVDTDAEQQIAAAFQVQSIPSVFAVIKGQPLPLFQGAIPEAQVRQFVEALLAEAAKLGVSGRIGAIPEDQPDEVSDHEPPTDPRLDTAYDAVEAGDWQAARQAYQEVLRDNASDPDASAGLRLVDLYERTDGIDAAAAIADAAADRDNLSAQLLAADIEAIQGNWTAAFERLIGVVRRTSGDDRAQVRTRLVEFFDVAGQAEPAVAKARVSLANALF